MKKKAMLWFVLLCCTISPLVAQKYYSDRENGYSGKALAQYMGTFPKKEIEEKAHMMSYVFNMMAMGQGLTFMGPLEKISKEVNFFIWSALNEYRFSDNEVYGITINSDNLPFIVLVFVIITDNGKNYQCLYGSQWT